MTARHVASFGALFTTAYLCLATSPVPEATGPAAQLDVPFAPDQTEAFVRVQLTGTDVAFGSLSGERFSAALTTSAEPLPRCAVPFSNQDGVCFRNSPGGDVEFILRIERPTSGIATPLTLVAYARGESKSTGTAWIGELEQYAFGVTLELL